MTNPYAPYVKDTRYTPQKPWKESKANQALVFTDYLYEALSSIMDTDAADGVVTGTVSGTLTARWDAPLRLVNSNGAGKAWSLFIRDSDDLLVAKKAVGSTPPTPSSEDDYDAVISEAGNIDPTGPTF